MRIALVAKRHVVDRLAGEAAAEVKAFALVTTPPPKAAHARLLGHLDHAHRFRLPVEPWSALVENVTPKHTRAAHLERVDVRQPRIGSRSKVRELHPPHIMPQLVLGRSDAQKLDGELPLIWPELAVAVGIKPPHDLSR